MRPKATVDRAGGKAVPGKQELQLRNVEASLAGRKRTSAEPRATAAPQRTQRLRPNDAVDSNPSPPLKRPDSGSSPRTGEAVDSPRIKPLGAKSNLNRGNRRRAHASSNSRARSEQRYTGDRHDSAQAGPGHDGHFRDEGLSPPLTALSRERRRRPRVGRDPVSSGLSHNRCRYLGRCRGAAARDKRGRGRRRPKDPPRDAGSGLPASSPWCRRQRETRLSLRPTRSPSGGAPPAVPLHVRSCDPPEHADHAAGDFDVGTADRLEAFVLRLEADVVALAEVALDRGLGLGVVLADDRDDDVAIVGGVLLAHDDRVAVEDARVLHRVTANLEDEVAGVTARERGDLDVFLDVLLGEDRSTGGDAADEGET